MNEVLPVVVVGCGRMGKLHGRVYSQMPNVKLVGVFDNIPANAKVLADQCGCAVLNSLQDVIAKAKGATIATPTEHHLAMALPLLEAGVACMVEKPLARDLNECQQLIDAAKRGKAVLQVGHVERFNPAVRSVACLSLTPRFIETVRVSPLTFRSIDVGVVLDVMIHDIDIVLSLARSPVKKVDATGVSVIGSAEDVCNARITFENGCVANMTASRLALKTERRLRLATSDCWVAIDYGRKQGIMARRGENLEKIRETVKKVRSGEIADPTKLSFMDMVSLEPLQVDAKDQLMAEQQDFVESIQSGRRPTVSGEDGMSAVELAGRIIQAMGATGI